MRQPDLLCGRCRSDSLFSQAVENPIFVLQALVAKEKEPITPFLSKIKALTDLKVSCILVIGGSGDYFSVADTVLCMEDFTCKDVSAQAHSIAQQFGDVSAMQELPPYGQITARTPMSIHPPSEGSKFLSNDM